jgi:hypothetical protein
MISAVIRAGFCYWYYYYLTSCKDHDYRLHAPMTRCDQIDRDGMIMVGHDENIKSTRIH